MKPISNSDPADQPLLPARFHQWLESRPARFVLLGAALILSIPPFFALNPDIGLDPSWQLSLQLAAINHKIFGRDFMFTYGPLGFLFVRGAVNKGVLLLFDLFVMASLFSIYRKVLPARPKWSDVFIFIGLAVVTKSSLSTSSAILFCILGYWLWRVSDGANVTAAAGALIAATVLFFGKVNYGLITIFMIPAYAIALLALRKDRRSAALALLFGFPLLIFLGTRIWRVDLAGYFRSGLEIIAGYNSAMFTPPLKSLVAFEWASFFLLAMGMAAYLGRRRLEWQDQMMVLPFVGLAALLLFKNGFVRSDDSHNFSFCQALPLLLAVWMIGWRGAPMIRLLLGVSVLYPLALLTAQTGHFGRAQLVVVFPLRYVKQAIALPWRESAAHLQQNLARQFPEAVLPADIKSAIGQGSVDVMPWESSIAVLNGLTYQPRPIPQSYSAYTPWLDEQNGSFLASTNAPDFVLFVCGDSSTIDGRAAAWDESITKMSLLKNYSAQTVFNLPVRIWPHYGLEPATVFLLRRTPHCRDLIPISTNQVSLALNQRLEITNTTNLVYLTLDVNPSLLEKIEASALTPSWLMVSFKYQDGSSRHYRAILPILKTGVLINRRVESADETRHWLAESGQLNMGVASIGFVSANASAFPTPFKGRLVEYRLQGN